jgi:CheY-like chemotaxis protein
MTGMTSNILVVDDDADLRETLQLLLDDSGYGVTAVANGRAALDQLKAGARPSLILLDLMMPEMNGWQFLERARADSMLGSIPVVIMTARRKGGDLLPAPSRQVLHKPFDRFKLLTTIARYATLPP